MNREVESYCEVVGITKQMIMRGVLALGPASTGIDAYRGVLLWYRRDGDLEGTHLISIFSGSSPL